MAPRQVEPGDRWPFAIGFGSLPESFLACRSQSRHDVILWFQTKAEFHPCPDMSPAWSLTYYPAIRFSRPPEYARNASTAPTLGHAGTPRTTSRLQTRAVSLSPPRPSNGPWASLASAGSNAGSSGASGHGSAADRKRPPSAGSKQLSAALCERLAMRAKRGRISFRRRWAPPRCLEDSV